MAHEFRKREDEEELIRRFEDNLKRNSTDFFDIDAYETIIDYYLDNSKFKKADSQSFNRNKSQWKIKKKKEKRETF